VATPRVIAASSSGLKPSTKLCEITKERAAQVAQAASRPFMTEEEWINKYVRDAPRLTPEQVRALLAIAGHQLAPAAG
jgi:glucokinase